MPTFYSGYQADMLHLVCLIYKNNTKMKSDFTEGHVPDYFLAVCLEKSH